MKRAIGKAAPRMLAIMICLAALQIPFVTVGSSQDDLWRVTAHATVRTSRQGSRVLTHSVKITPDQLVKASQVNTREEHSVDANSVTTINMTAVLRNEGGDGVVVFSDAEPVSMILTGGQTRRSRQKAITHVNGIVAQFSTQETDETHIDFTKGSFRMEWSENLYCSLDGYGTGTHVSLRKRMEQGSWRAWTNQDKTSGDDTVSCSREDKEAVFRKSGKGYVVTFTRNSSETKEDPYYGKVTETVQVNLTAVVRPSNTPEVRIFRRKGGGEEDITNRTVEVLAGEAVELKAIILPKGKSGREGRWELVPDGREKNYLKKFAADNSRGKVLYPEEQDLRQNELSFFWFSGARGWVKHAVSVDGEECRAWAEFKIRAPTYEVTWQNSPDSHFGESTGGNPALRDQWPKEYWVPTTPGYDKEGLSGRLGGLEYNGILFRARNTSDVRGRVQWVQIIRDVQRGTNLQNVPFENEPYEGLDHVYPCSSGEIFYDAPAIPIYRINDDSSITELGSFADSGSFAVDMQFRLYLMFMPEGPANEWVPVQVVHWNWKGAVIREGAQWARDTSTEPHADDGNEPDQEDAQGYPEWEKNASGNPGKLQGQVRMSASIRFH